MPSKYRDFLPCRSRMRMRMLMYTAMIQYTVVVVVVVVHAKIFGSYIFHARGKPTKMNLFSTWTMVCFAQGGPFLEYTRNIEIRSLYHTIIILCCEAAYLTCPPSFGARHTSRCFLRTPTFCRLAMSTPAKGARFLLFYHRIHAVRKVDILGNISQNSLTS